MTRDEIIAMAREVGITCKVLDDEYCDSVGMKRGSVGRIESVKFIELELFASLVAAKERDEIIDLVAFHGGSVEIEAAIRARSNTTT